MTVEIRQGDVRELLAAMPDESVHCVVTSPPYWGQRDYGVAGQIGLEPTLAEHLAVMVDIFREVRRVLRKDGTCWRNNGDGYARAPEKGGSGPNGKNIAYSDCYTCAQSARVGSSDGVVGRGDRPGTRSGGAKPKDLLMIPNRLAIALQDDGWWVRSEIIWAKPNPMPESVTDRPSCAHEKLWLLTKAARYYYDAEAVKTASMEPPGLKNPYSPEGSTPHSGARRSPNGKHSDKQRGHSRKHAGFNARWDAMTKEEQRASANLRNVWTIATKPFADAHFATFPPDLVVPCIKAGCPEGGTVLDPFGGAGTTGLVADRLGRNAILLELNADYAEMARARIASDAGMFASVT